MCGRFSLFESIELLQTEFEFEYNGDFQERYNIAPGQPILAVINIGSSRKGMDMKWGLIPNWANDEKIGYKMINARSETIDEKASFKHALKKRRCLILADGFYEWKKDGKIKQPYRFEMKDRRPFAFAGLWENWEKDGEKVISCTIVTTNANELTQKVHDRMPVILPKDKQHVWLNPSIQDFQELKQLLVPYDANSMKSYQISTAINSAKNEGKELILPLNSL